MQNDEIIWQVINHQFCSFKSKVAKEKTFCMNPFNVTGLCNRSACPLANSRYATIREEDGKVYLCLKTVERAHTPKDLWERVLLPKNYTKALEFLTEQLQFFPKYLQHRNKQRLTKIHQYLIRMRKLKLEGGPKIVALNTRLEKLEKRKEGKALKAANLEKSIEDELLERLKQASEGEIYNFPEKEYTKAVAKASKGVRQQHEDVEDAEDDDEELEEELEDDEDEEYGTVEYVEDMEESDDEDVEDAGLYDDEDDDEDDEDERPRKRKAEAPKGKKGRDDGSAGAGGAPAKGGKAGKREVGSKAKKAKKTGPRVEIEYEEEEEEEPRARSKAVAADMQFNF